METTDVDSIKSFSNREQNTNVFERNVCDTSERISSFNICETARKSQPTSGKEDWKVENSFFFLLFLLIMVLLHLSQLSPQVWERPYPKQTHAYHVGSTLG